MNDRDRNFDNRGQLITFFIVGIALVFVIRLVFLQLLTDKYDAYAGSNAQLRRVVYPERGLIYDREGRVMVFNSIFYDLMLTPREMKGLDTLDFCRTMNITREDFDKRMADIRNRKLNPGYSSYTPQLFLSQLTVEQYGPLQEALYRFPGFSIRKRSLRQYSRPIAAHALGYVGEVNARDLETDSYYSAGDLSGRSGVERMYEKELRGEKGCEIFLRDVHGRVKGPYNEGLDDIPAVAGHSLTLSLDMELQEYAERLMTNKRGAVVAIEPSTGEILCFVSSPSYDPGLLVGNESSKHYRELLASPDKIFLNRPIQSFYPPGSTFKAMQALVLLQEGIITPETSVACHGGYFSNGVKMGCHNHTSPLSLVPAISTSCNAYFAASYRAMIDAPKYGTSTHAMDVWRSHILSFGYGERLGVDMAYEQRGSIPTSARYNRIYGENHWKGSTIVSNSIGQGEIEATPLQIANFCATIANRGWFITPHIVKGIEGSQIDSIYTQKHEVSVDPKYFPYIVQGMRGAVNSAIGTSHGVDIPGIEICGKTGTAQNKGKDHSIFMCFAPMDHPKISMMVFVENGGFGATWAVPTASLLLEKYLNDTIADNRLWMEKRLLEADLM